MPRELYGRWCFLAHLMEPNGICHIFATASFYLLWHLFGSLNSSVPTYVITVDKGPQQTEQMYRKSCDISASFHQAL